MDLLSRKRIDLNAFVLNWLLFWLDEIREIEIELPLSWAHKQFATLSRYIILYIQHVCCINYGGFIIYISSFVSF